MWETLSLPARGTFSLRKMTRNILAALVTACFLTILNTVAAHAADATWQDSSTISYGGKTYTQETSPAGVNAAPGSTIFVSRDEMQRTASVLVIPPNTDQTKEMGNVEVTNYTIAQNGSLTNAQRPPNGIITLDAKPAPKNKTQCDVAGVGWIVCVVSRFIADGMDNIFNIIAGFLEVKPISTDRTSGLYKAWSVALGIANMSFILAFLVIIYSQITSYGINNYNIKKMIPKLIVSAILVNVSFYICAVAVDISNILGYSVQQAFIDIRQSLPDPVAGSLDSFTWKNITEYILSGGTIVAGAFAAKAAFLGGTVGGSISGLSFLLLPALVAGALAVLIALLVLAARQALITVLIVMAPLAFVAYLLPNTEKWFEKWRDLFMTMLLVFPLFSLLFGGSQLASYIIINNADQLSVIIFAMFIQVAPLAVTPFLVKFSGSLLGRLAGMVNNPSKGIIDRTKGWATERAQVQRAKGMEAAARAGNRGGTRFQRSAFRRELEKKNRESWIKRGDEHADAAWHQDSRYRAHHSSISAAGMRKNAGESAANRHFENERANSTVLQRYAGAERANNEAIKALQSAETAAWEEAKSNKMEANNRFRAFSNDAKVTLENQKIADGRIKFAQSEQSDEWTKRVLADQSLQAKMGGIGGAERALSHVAAEYRKNYNERIAEGEQLLKHFNLSGGQRQDHALGKVVHVADAEGNVRAFRPDNKYTREAAIDLQMKQGTLKEVEQIIEKSGTDLKGYSTTIAQAMADRKVSGMAVYLGGQTINDVGQGKVVGSQGLDQAFVTTLLKGKVSATDLATGDADALKRMFRVASQGAPANLNPAEQAKFDEKVKAMKQQAFNALTNPSLKGSVRDNSKIELIRMLQTLDPTGVVHDADGNPVTDYKTREY